MASDEGRAQAEAAAAATRNALQAYATAGTADSDPILKQLEERLQKEEAALQRRKNPPTAGRKKTALVAAMDLYIDRQKELKDSAEAGRHKAATRARERVEQLQTLLDTVNRLKDAADEVNEALTP